MVLLKIVMSDQLLSLSSVISAIDNERCGQVELEDFISAISRSSRIKNDMGAAALCFFISQLRIFSPKMTSLAHIYLRPVTKSDVDAILSKVLPKIISLLQENRPISGGRISNNASLAQRKWNHSIMYTSKAKCNKFDINMNMIRNESNSTRVRLKKSEMIGLGGGWDKSKKRGNDSDRFSGNLKKNIQHGELQSRRLGHPIFSHDEDNPYL